MPELPCRWNGVCLGNILTAGTANNNSSERFIPENDGGVNMLGRGLFLLLGSGLAFLSAHYCTRFILSINISILSLTLPEL